MQIFTKPSTLAFGEGIANNLSLSDSLFIYIGDLADCKIVKKSYSLNISDVIFSIFIFVGLYSIPDLFIFFNI